MGCAENMGLLSAAARMSLFARRPSAGALTFYTASETLAPPGHRAWLLLAGGDIADEEYGVFCSGINSALLDYERY